MKLPKTVQISGKTYRVTSDSKNWGGSCTSGKQVINVGTASSQSSHRIFSSLTHEILEAVTLERRLRYEAADDEIVFVMTHKQFDDFAKDVATAMKPLIKGFK